MRILDFTAATRISHTTAFLILVAVATLSLLTTFLQPTFISAYDATFHIYNTQRYAEELSAGIWYPRWIGDWFAGYGAPFGVVYPPLPYYSAAILTNLGLSTFTSVKLVLWLSLLFSGWTMYLLVREFLPEPAAMGAAIFYQLAPYHTIDLFSRAALPEYIAFAWMPLIFLTTYRLTRTFTLRDCLLLAVSGAGLILTHLLTAYIVALTIVIYVFTLLVLLRKNWLHVLPRLLLPGVFIGVLSSVFVLPWLFEINYLDSESYTQVPWGNYLNNFLFNPLGGGPDDPESNILLTNIVGAGAAMSLALAALVILLNRRHHGQDAAGSRTMSIAMTVVLVLSILMSLSISQPLWSVIPFMPSLQFPWRWQTVSTLAVAYLVGDAILYLPSLRLSLLKSEPIKQGLRLALVGLIGLNLLFSLGLIGFRTLMREPMQEEIIGSFEAQPSDREFFYLSVFRNMVQIMPIWGKDFDYYSAPVEPENRVIGEAMSGVEIDSWQSTRRLFRVTVESETTLNIRSFWYPGWEASVNGQPAPLELNADDGTILLTLPEGEADVELRFTDTPVRTAGALISAGGILGIVLMGLLSLIRHRSPEPLADLQPQQTT